MNRKPSPHPGELIYERIEQAQLTVTEAAAVLGITRPGLSELLNAKRGVSPEMSVRLSRAFGDTEECWLARQAQYDLAHIRRDRIKVKRLNLV